MSLTQAAASFRVFQFEAKLSPDVLSAFAEDAVPPFEVLRDEPLAGWATPRFLTDAEISGETCHAGKFLHLSLTREERRIPKALLTVYCRREELRFMKEKGVNALSRQDRQAIKEAVRKQMLPRTPPSLAGNDVAIDLDRSLLYTDAKTDKQVDLLAERFAKAARTALVPLDAAGAAQRLFNVRTDELAPASFTPENNGDFVVNDIGASAPTTPSSSCAPARPASPSPSTVRSPSSSRRRAPSRSACATAPRSRAARSSPPCSAARRSPRSSSSSPSGTTPTRPASPRRPSPSPASSSRRSTRTATPPRRSSTAWPTSRPSPTPSTPSTASSSATAPTPPPGSAPSPPSASGSRRCPSRRSRPSCGIPESAA